jgi:hypothetical protein
MMGLANRLAAKAGIDGRAQQGAAIVIVAASMVVLLGFAAFSVDFGWLYLNGIRIQHGADAAALAGVVYEPGDQTSAYLEARRSAAENGYDNDADGTTVTPIDFSEDASAVQNQYQLAVEIEHSVDTFFMKVFGIDSITIGKRAVAEYVLPLPMGSNLPYFGDDPTNDDHNAGFWANIHGYYVSRSYGDRYAAQCLDANTNGSSCTVAGESRATVHPGGNSALAPISGGYLYGIEVPDGATSLTVGIFDGPFYTGGGDHILVGDNPQGGSGVGPTTWFILYPPDPTPLNTADNGAPLCAVEYPPVVSFADFNGDGWANAGDDQDGDGDLDWDDVAVAIPNWKNDLWDNMCGTINISAYGGGVYPLRVAIANSDVGMGLNRYSLRTSTSTGTPRIYGLGDMAVYVNFPGSHPTLNLAEVQPVHAGKDMVIELWDPDSGNTGTHILKPSGASGDTPTCDWIDSGGGSHVNEPCDIVGYGGSAYQNKLLTIRVHIPGNYSCSADCWWHIQVDYSGTAQDTTTWSAHIEGNPVALVE